MNLFESPFENDRVEKLKNDLKRVCGSSFTPYDPGARDKAELNRINEPGLNPQERDFMIEKLAKRLKFGDDTNGY